MCGTVSPGREAKGVKCLKDDEIAGKINNIIVNILITFILKYNYNRNQRDYDH